GTGMDGVEGLEGIIASGGAAFVQNPANCLFKETPSAVIEANTIEYLVSDKQMAGAINAYLNSHSA
ncbi:MAG: chemotaxis protein CheB, partial [Desulfosarcinaceae bacterium]